MAERDLKPMGVHRIDGRYQLDIPSVLADLPPEDLVQLIPSDDKEGVHVPQIMVKMCGGNLAGLMRLADTRKDDDAVHVPFSLKVVYELGDFLNGEPVFTTNFTAAFWIELFLAARMYQVNALTSVLQSTEVLTDAVRRFSCTGDRFILMNFAKKHKLESLARALASIAAFREGLDTPELLMQYTDALLKACECSECRHIAEIGLDSALE